MRLCQSHVTVLFSLVMACMAGKSLAQEQKDNPAEFVPSEACIKVLRSNCDATQQQLLQELLDKLEIYGIGEQLGKYAGKPPAFEELPKDATGQVNWVRALSQGLIKPHDNLAGTTDATHEGFYDNLIFMQVKVHIMADVVFPHGMHTNWLSCNSCHPKPFKEGIAVNPIQMDEIFEGKWCGKCHGKVAFSPADYDNCRRCHVLPKKPLGQH